MLKKTAYLILSLILLIFAGCTAQNQTGPDNQEKAETIMNDFQTLIRKDPSVEETANFLNNNIFNVSQEDASKMVDEFEKNQKKNLPQFEELFNSDSIQKKINSEYQSIINQAEIKDGELKEFLTKTTNSGYKIETAEGSFFPIINYEFYKKFSSYVTPDIKDYIEIMAVESNKAPAKDAEFVIGWNEIIKRALEQEKFLNTHKDSVKTAEIRQLYQKYLRFSLIGVDNTPLFRYDTKTMVDNAKEVYINAVKDTAASDYLKTLNGFLDLVKNSNFKLTQEVEQYRDNVLK
jgi:hypothetical protein